MRPELSARANNREPNARVNSDEPIDWLAEFDSETESDPKPEPEFADVPHRSYADADLAMFPAEAVEHSEQPDPRQEPLFHVLPAGPPTGPQLRSGDYLGNPSPDSLDALLAGVDRAVNRLPDYRTAMIAQLHRRRAVFVATAAILVISTAATAGSLAMRRWQRPPDRVADQRVVDAGSASAPSGGGLFGASLAAPVAPAVTNPPQPVTNVAPPKPSPTVTPAAPVPKATPKPTPTPERIAAVTPNTPPAAGNRPVTLGASPVATPTPSPTLTPTPTGPPVRPPVATSAATPTPTSTPTPTPAPARPPRPTPAAVSPEAADTAAIQGVIDRYRRTFDSLSVDDVAAFWPSVNVRSLSRAFDQLASQHLSFEGCSIDLRGHQADATCRGRVQFVPKVGSHTPRVENRQWTFLFLRADGGWTITRVEVK